MKATRVLGTLEAPGHGWRRAKVDLRNGDGRHSAVCATETKIPAQASLERGTRLWIFWFRWGVARATRHTPLGADMDGCVAQLEVVKEQFVVAAKARRGQRH